MRFSLSNSHQCSVLLEMNALTLVRYEGVAACCFQLINDEGVDIYRMKKKASSVSDNFPESIYVF